MADLDIRSVQKEKAVVLQLDGFINAHTVQEFEKAVQGLVDSGTYQILINCSGLAYINSSGLGVLMGVIEEIQENDGFLYLSNMNETVYNIFDTLGFTHLFKVFETEDEALASIQTDESGDAVEKEG